MKTLARMMLAAAATSLAIAPVAAQAGTRASQSSPIYSVSAPGKGREAKGESLAPFAFFFVTFISIAGTVATVAVVAAGSTSDTGRSPGT